MLTAVTGVGGNDSSKDMSLNASGAKRISAEAWEITERFASDGSEIIQALWLEDAIKNSSCTDEILF